MPPAVPCPLLRSFSGLSTAVLPMRKKKQNQEGRKNEFVRDFKNQFGFISCRELVGYDFSDKEAAERVKEAGTGMANCPKYIRFALEKIYELDSKSRD